MSMVIVEDTDCDEMCIDYLLYVLQVGSLILLLIYT